MAAACTTWLPDSDDEFRLSKCQSLSSARLTILFKLTGTVLRWVAVLVMPLRLSNSILSWITNNILFLYRKENASMQGHFDNCEHQIYLTVFCWTDISNIQLFRKRLSEKVHATIPKGIVGGFEFTVLQRNLKEWHERPWKYVCEW